MIVADAEAVARAATRQALDAALDAYRDAGVALDVARTHPIGDGVAYQTAMRRLQAARQNLRTCWALHFGEPLPC
jgi:hypothetical protein